MSKFLTALVLVTACACTSCGISKAVMQSKKVETVQLYCVDKDIHKLIPYNRQISAASPQKAAEIVIDELVNGMNYEKIQHIIPKVKDGITVKVEGESAIVNFSEEMVRQHPSDMDSEYLTVYSIVNSLATIDEIVGVKFTINGEVKKDFKGFIDMRETFIPCYMY